MSEIYVDSMIGMTELRDWIFDAQTADFDSKIQMICDAVISEAEEEMKVKIKPVADHEAVLDGGRPYLYLPHLNVSDVAVYEDFYRQFGAETELDSGKYQVYGPQGVLRMGRRRFKWEGGLAVMDKYFNEWLMDDYYFDRLFEGRREFLRGNQVIKVKYDGGYTYETIPSDLKMAVLQQTNYRFRRRKDPGLTAVTYPDGSVNKFSVAQWLPEVQAVLDKYKRYSLGGR